MPVAVMGRVEGAAEQADNAAARRWQRAGRRRPPLWNFYPPGHGHLAPAEQQESMAADWHIASRLSWRAVDLGKEFANKAVGGVGNELTSSRKNR